MKTASRKLIYILSIVMLSTTLLLGTFLVLSLAGAFGGYNNEITISTPNITKEYSGESVTSKEYKIENGAIKEGHRVKVVSNSSITTPGEIINTVKLAVYDTDGEDVTSKYNFNYNYGKIKVKPYKISVKTQSAKELFVENTEYYFGGVYVNETFYEEDTVTLATGDVLAITLPTFTEKGEFENTGEISITNAQGEDVSSYYELSTEFGKVEIKQYKLKFTTSTAEKVYDGEPLTSTNFKIVEGKEEGHSYKAKLDTCAEVTEVKEGEVENYMELIIKDEDGTDVTDTYIFEPSYGTLKILPKELEATSGIVPIEKTYNGSKIFTFEIQDYGIVSGQTLYVTGETQSADVGEYLVPIEDIIANSGVSVISGENSEIGVKILDGTGYDVTSNYILNTTVIFKVKINTKDINLDEVIAEKEYDSLTYYSVLGKAEGLDANQFVLIDGLTYVNVGEYSGITDAGLAFTLVNERLEDCSLNYNIVSDNFSLTLTITPKPLQITTASAEKSYDGTPLICHELDQEKTTGLLGNHQIVNSEIEYTGSQTEVGHSANELIYETIKIQDINTFEYVELYNYQINLTCGALTVTDIEQMETDMETTLFTINSNTTGDLYLKNKSYGDYLQRAGWKTAPTCDLTAICNGTNPQSYMSKALKAESIRLNTVTIKGAPLYVVPYYQSVDNFYYGSLDYKHSFRGTQEEFEEYSVDFYNYDFAFTQKVLPTTADYDGYYQFLLQNYLSIPDSTLAYLEENLPNILSAKNLNLNTWRNAYASGDFTQRRLVIQEISNFVRTCADYDLNHQHERSEDEVISFLQIRKGICRQYAALGTLIYRMVGIPARYTDGYMINVAQTNTDVEVKVKNGHAWVEVFVEGVGWACVEVTGSVAPPPGEVEPEPSPSADKLIVYVNIDATSEQIKLVVNVDNLEGTYEELSEAYEKVDFNVTSVGISTRVVQDGAGKRKIILDNGDEISVTVMPCSNFAPPANVEMKYKVKIVDDMGEDITEDNKYTRDITMGEWTIVPDQNRAN